MPSDDEGVAPETAEDNRDIFDLSVSEIAQAANASDSFIDSLTSDSDEAPEPQEVEEEEEVTEEEDTEEEEVEEGEDEELDDEPEEPKGDSPGIKKRIGKLVERAKRAEAEAERLQSELESQEETQGDSQIPGSDRFETVNDSRKLDKMEADAEHLREWLMTNPEGGEYEDRGGGKYDVDYELAKSLHVQTDRDLRKNIPNQRASLQQRSTAFQTANKTFPWMQDNGTNEFVEMAGILANNPRAKKFYETDPHAALFFGYAVEGYKSVHGKQGKKAKGGKVEQAPSVPTAPPRTKRATKNTSGAAKQSKLKKAALRSGDQHDVRSYLESII